MIEENEFYRLKHENELMILEEELKMKHQLSSFSKSKNTIVDLIKMPFQTNSTPERQHLKIENSLTEPDTPNLFQDSIKLIRSIKEITDLTKSILHQIKS